MVMLLKIPKVTETDDIVSRWPITFDDHYFCCNRPYIELDIEM